MKPIAMYSDFPAILYENGSNVAWWMRDDSLELMWCGLFTDPHLVGAWVGCESHQYKTTEHRYTRLAHMLHNSALPHPTSWPKE